jgi:hypothetical protein
MPDSTKAVLVILGAGLSVGFWLMTVWASRKRHSARLPRVRVYDPMTATVRLMPAAELAPGMVAATVRGVSGVVWVDATQLEEGRHRHPPLSPVLRSQIWRIYHALWDVYPQTVEEWEDGFRRDVDPAMEIAIWLHIAQAYDAVTASRALTPAQKRDYFNVLVACSMTPREHLFSTVALQAISREDAEEAIRIFDGTRTRRSGVIS